MYVSINKNKRQIKNELPYIKLGNPFLNYDFKRIKKIIGMETISKIKQTVKIKFDTTFLSFSTFSDGLTSQTNLIIIEDIIEKSDKIPTQYPKQ